MPLKNWSQIVADAGDTGKAFEPLPDGVYDFLITDAAYRPSQSGKDGYNITAQVESGPYKKRTVFNTFYVSPDSPSALGIFLRQMSVLGLDAAFFQREPSDDQIVAALKDKRFRGAVTTSEWQGKKRNELKTVENPNPAPATGVPTVSSGPTVPSVSVPSVTAAPTVPTVAAPSVAAPTVATPSAPAVSVTKTDDPWANATVPSVPSGITQGSPEKPF